MQTDMHYYGTYALARCAGVRDDIALAIATAAEYVDDSDYVDETLADGTRVHGNPTAHHPMDVHNLALVDQRHTWIPFHFIPGNVGVNLYERLRCQIDSPIARAMVSRNVALANEPSGIVLLGITAHVYADTFAHYGFSGITSVENQIAAGSIELDLPEKVQQAMRRKENEFIARFITAQASTLATKTDVAAQAADFLSELGHAGVATYPDQPFLRWRFTYSQNHVQTPWRDNQSTFLLGSQRLFEMFVRFHDVTENAYLAPEQRRPFEEIEPALKVVLATVGEVDVRIAAWQEAARSGRLYPNPDGSEIPRYDMSEYANDRLQLAAMDPGKAKRTVLYDFNTAANDHRTFVNEHLLREHDILITDSFFGALAETMRDWIKL